jgi:hypothetical protein
MRVKKPMVTATAAAGVAANTATTTTGLDERARIDHSPGPSEGSGARMPLGPTAWPSGTTKRMSLVA